MKIFLSSFAIFRQIRQDILQRYPHDPRIRINVSIAKPKIRLHNVPVLITGVYDHVFQIGDSTSPQAKRYTLQYTDVLTHNIEILDL